MNFKIYILTTAAIFALSCTSYRTTVKDGDTCLERYMFRKAENEYKSAIRKDPEQSAAYIKLARLLMKNGRHGEALLLLQRSLYLKNPQPASWSLLSAYYGNRGDMERASYFAEAGLARFRGNRELTSQRKRISLALFLKKCSGLLAKKPGAAGIRKMLGYRLLAGDFIWLALNQFNKLAENDPDNIKLFRMLSSLFLKKGNSAKAREYLEKLLKADRSDSFALRNLGQIELNNGHLFKAYRHFFNNAKYHPNNGKAFETVGYLTLRMGKKSKALEYLERAYLLGRRSDRLFASIGYLYTSNKTKEDIKKGRRYLEMAGKLKAKRDRTPRSHRAAIIRSRIERLKQFQIFFHGNRKKESDVRYRLALQYRKLNDNANAYLHLLQAYTFFPDDPSYLMLKAELELNLGRFGDISTTIKKLERITPVSVKLFRLKCRLYKSGPLGDSGLYRKTIQTAIRKLPGQPFFHLKLAELYLASQKPSAALNAFRKAEKLGAPVGGRIANLTRALEINNLQRQISDTDDPDRALTLALKLRTITGTSGSGYRTGLKRALSLSPRSAGINILLGESYGSAFFKEMKYSHLKNALHALEKALKIYPAHSRARAIRNRLLGFDHKGFLTLSTRLQAQKRDNALADPLALANRTLLIKKFPEILGSRFFTLGKILYRKNRSAASIPYISRSILLDKSQAVHKLLAKARIQRSLGNFDSAVDAYRNLLRQKKLPEFRQYAIIYATLGNLYTQKVLSYPYNYNYLRKKYLNSGKNLPAIVAKIVSTLREGKTLGKRAFQGYIMRNTLNIQRNMGKNKIRSLMRIPADREEVYLRIAAIIRAEKDSSEYLKILEKAAAVLKKGKRRRILLSLASEYELNGNRKKAAALYAQLDAENTNDWRQVYARARWELSRGNLDRSLKTFQRAASLNRRDLGLRIIIGFLQWQKGRMDLAVKELKQVLAIDEQNINASYYLCKIFSQQGKFEDAEKHGNRVQELFKKKLPVNYVDRNKKEMLLDTIHTLARVAFLRGDILRALKYAYAGSGFDSTDSFHFLSLTGDIFFLQKKYTRAEYYYSRAVKHNPTVPFLRFKLARTYLKNGKNLLGKRILEDIYNRMPRFNKRAELLLLLARLRGTNNRLIDQETLLKQLIREFPVKQQGYLALAELYRKQNRFAEQSVILENGLKKIRKAPGIRDAIAWYILDRGQSLRRALQLARQNVDLQPGNANFRATYGYILFRLKRFRDSRQNLSARQIAFYRKEDFYRRNDTMENAAEFYRTGRFRKAFQLVCYPRPGIYGTKTLFADTLFSRLILQRDSVN